MAVKMCSDCGGSVSTVAKACPHCGAPVSTKGRFATTKVEFTSKPLKGFLIFCNMVQLLGLFGIVAGIANERGSDVSTGFSLLFLGVAMHIVGRALIWWNHG